VGSEAGGVVSDKTSIEWTDATWNPVTGCTKVSPGCDHCYAETLAERFRGTPGHYYERGFDVQLRPEKLDQPLRWRRPRRVFVNSMSDLFHDDVPDDYIARVFAVMALAPQHTFQVLTKRHGRMRSLLNQTGPQSFRTSITIEQAAMARPWQPGSGLTVSVEWPLPNVWLGVSVENQQWADIRIPALLDTPAAVRFLSCEPLLGPVDLTDAIWPEGSADECTPDRCTCGIDWVIVGGESGRGARPMHPDWARSLRDQCAAAGVPFLFKQWGEWMPVRTPSGEHQERVGKKAAGRELDGRTWDEFPGGESVVRT
jgi:protein gp37